MLYALYTPLLLVLLLLTLPLWIWRYLRTGKYRHTLRQRLGWGLPSLPPAPRIWVHAVSVGEVMAAQGLIQQLAQRFPGHAILLSTVTKTGQQIAQTLPAVQATFYLPLDLPWIVNRVVRTIRPCCLIVLETELWPGLFYAMAAAGIPVMLVNGRLSPRSFRQYRKIRPLMERLLAKVQLFAMQSPGDAERMIALGALPQRVQVTGNMKYDQALQSVPPEKMAALAQRLPPPEGIIWIAASTHPGEEEILLACLNALQPNWPDLRLILVPRHPERSGAVAALLKQQGCSYALFSQLTGSWQERVLLVDGVGWLTPLYGYAHLAFVGGSLVPHGGQNMLEAASWGLPILFGPHTFNFREISRQLLEAGGAIQLQDAAELLPAMQGLLADSAACARMGAQAKQVIGQNSGAVARTLHAIQPYLPPAATGP
ncbi:MAG: 3-deoxy-D-manno-octulosonic acid transferase, partial [Magnetococcales bacterium]|nr:3-deoxy-D-manno-octulosonic acid transferase [Magnetococcales bacterium]